MRVFGVIVGVLVLLVAAVFLVIVQPGPSGVVASLRLRDGSEYMVAQRCNWSLEPYTVSFFMRPPGGRWGWCYIDHQARRWRGVKLAYDVDSDIVTVTKGGVWRAAFDRSTGSFAIGRGKPKRSVAAPQDLREPRFSFPE